MKQFVTRLTDLDNVRQDHFVDIHQDVSAFGVMEKPEINRHYHSYFKGSKTEDAYKKRFMKHGWLNSKGTKHQVFMCKAADKYKEFANQTVDERQDAILRYLCKGNSKDEMPNVILNTLGLTEEQIKDYHDRYWKVNEQLTHGKIKDKDKKLTFKEVVVERWFASELYQQLKLEDVEYHWDVSRFCYRIERWLMDEFKCLEKNDICTPTLKKYVNYLVLDVVSSEMLQKAWHRGDMTNYF